MVTQQFLGFQTLNGIAYPDFYLAQKKRAM